MTHPPTQTPPPNLADLVAADAATGGHSFADDIAHLSDAHLAAVAGHLHHLTYQVRRRAGARGMTLPPDLAPEMIEEYEPEGPGWVIAIAAVWGSVCAFLVAMPALAGVAALGPQSAVAPFALACAALATYFICRSRP